MATSWLKIDCGSAGKVLADPKKEYAEVQKIAGTRMSCKPKDIRLHIKDGDDDLWEVDESVWAAAVASGQTIFARSAYSAAGPTATSNSKRGRDSSHYSDDREVDMILELNNDPQPNDASHASNPAADGPVTLQLSKKERKRQRKEAEQQQQLRQEDGRNESRSDSSFSGLKSVQERQPTPAPAGFGSASKPRLKQGASSSQIADEDAGWKALKSATSMGAATSSRKHWDSRTHKLLFKKLDEILKRSPPDTTLKYMDERSRIFDILVSEWGDSGTRGKLFTGRSLRALVTRVHSTVSSNRSTGVHVPAAFNFLFPPTTKQLEEMQTLEREKALKKAMVESAAAKKKAKDAKQQQKKQQQKAALERVKQGGQRRPPQGQEDRQPPQTPLRSAKPPIIKASAASSSSSSSSSSAAASSSRPRISSASSPPGSEGSRSRRAQTEGASTRQTEHSIAWKRSQPLPLQHEALQQARPPEIRASRSGTASRAKQTTPSSRSSHQPRPSNAPLHPSLPLRPQVDMPPEEPPAPNALFRFVSEAGTPAPPRGYASDSQGQHSSSGIDNRRQSRSDTREDDATAFGSNLPAARPEPSVKSEDDPEAALHTAWE